MTLRTLNYGNYGIFLIMGNAGFCPSTVTVSIAIRSPTHQSPTPFPLAHRVPGAETAECEVPWQQEAREYSVQRLGLRG